MSEHRPTKKQRELLSYIEGFVGGNGYGPSYREIMRALNYKSVSTVATHVDNLIKKGHLRKRDHSARSLEVVVSGGTNRSAAPAPVSTAQSKWLVAQVQDRLQTAEQGNSLSMAELDGLYVLVGALHVLGFDDAARACKARLLALAAGKR